MRVVSFLFALSLLVSSAAAQPAALNEEVAVSGDASFAIAPDWVSITARLQQTSATAGEAGTSLASRLQKLTEAVKAVDPGAQIRLRGDKYVPPAPGALALKGGTPLTIERSIAVESGDVQKAGKLVDTVLGSGAAVVTEVAFSARNDLAPLISAIQLASKRAKEKADVAAAALGVKLGPVLSTVVTEEPEGEALRRQLQTGEPVTDFGDRVQHVYVTVRYSIAAK